MVYIYIYIRTASSGACVSAYNNDGENQAVLVLQGTCFASSAVLGGLESWDYDPLRGP